MIAVVMPMRGTIELFYYFLDVRQQRKNLRMQYKLYTWLVYEVVDKISKKYSITPCNDIEQKELPSFNSSLCHTIKLN
jgi:hypothetical protein